MGLISLLHPSRGRAAQGMATAKRWIESAGVPVEHIFSLDHSDKYAQDYNAMANGILIKNHNQFVVEATNRAAQIATGNILIYLSDDMDCIDNWGMKITEISHRYTGEFMIKVHDGLQEFRAEVLTIPIMSRALYNRLGYFFHPDYKSMWVDVDLYHTCNRIGAIKFHPEITFQHNHYCNGKAKRDETYNRSDANFETGRAINKQRFRQGYPC